MEPLALLALAFSASAFAVHVGSCGIAAWRCRPRSVPAPSGVLPPVTLIRPVCGLDHAVEETLASSFTLDHPEYEILFCVADRRDPVVPLVERLIASHPDRPARLLVGRDRFGVNPKLDNCAKGWEAARHDWVVMADSNLLLPRDYLRRVLSVAAIPDTGLVSAPPVGIAPDGFWGHVEAAILNGYQARVQYTVDAFGAGFAQGKTLALQKLTLEPAGGYAALGREPAEDAAATKAIRDLGLKVRLVCPPFGQPIGRRSGLAVWSRQLRWARLRRATFPWLFVPEILSGSVPPLLALLAAADAAGVSPLAATLGFLALWHVPEALLLRVTGWPMGWRAPFTWVVRDLAIPVLWVCAWLGSGYAWRGQDLSAKPGGPEPLAVAE